VGPIAFFNAFGTGIPLFFWNNGRKTDFIFRCYSAIAEVQIHQLSPLLCGENSSVG